jgi:hypothetical protein
MSIVKDFYMSARNAWPSNAEVSWDGTVRELGTDAPAMLSQQTPWAVTGGVSGGYSSAPSMACVTWRTSLATRRGRGRTFLGPVGANAVDSGDGTLNTGILGVIRGAATALVSASDNALNGAVGVYSELDGVVRDVVASTVTDQVAVLRSRR